MPESEPRKQRPIWERIREHLQQEGIDLDVLCGGDCGDAVKVFGLGLGLGDSVKEMGKTRRDQVVMVRVDEETAQTLDAWVETGAVKSRSEAAALFIREGLKVRASELAKLRDALADVEAAKSRLKDKAREVFGEEAAG